MRSTFHVFDDPLWVAASSMNRRTKAMRHLRVSKMFSTDESLARVEVTVNAAEPVDTEHAALTASPW